jgi:hypothetical protein
MLANRLLYSRNGLLWEYCVGEQISGHLSADKRVVASMTAFSFLPNIVKGDCRPDGGKIAALVGLNGIGKRHNAYKMVVIVRCIATLFSFHCLISKFKKPTAQFYHMF